MTILILIFILILILIWLNWIAYIFHLLFIYSRLSTDTFSLPH